MVVSSNGEINIIGEMEGTAGVRLNNNRQKLRQRFDIIRKLGQGTYGKVQLAINKDTGEEVAIKTIKKGKIETEQDLVRIQREIQIMSSVQHPHIIHIYEVFENKEKIVLVMEYASGGELYDYLSYKKSLGECEARRLFRQIVSAVYYCHKNKICHRDLKLENILLDENGNAKIADFGLSNVFDEKRLLSTFCGSPLYASPEIVKGTPYYGPEVDCWSLGVLLYTLVYGAMPFDGSNFRRLVKQISEGDYYEPKKPSEASGLIRRLLTVLPAKRATVEDVCNDWWVNLGFQEHLLEVSEEMCNAMPVRLDYLLQLVPPTASSSLSNIAAKETGDNMNAYAESEQSKDGENVSASSDVEGNGEKSSNTSHQDTPSDNIDERCCKVSDSTEVDSIQSSRKHKLTGSQKSLTSESSEKIESTKKKKRKAASACSVAEILACEKLSACAAEPCTQEKLEGGDPKDNVRAEANNLRMHGEPHEDLTRSMKSSGGRPGVEEADSCMTSNILEECPKEHSSMKTETMDFLENKLGNHSTVVPRADVAELTNENINISQKTALDGSSDSAVHQSGMNKVGKQTKPVPAENEDCSKKQSGFQGFKVSDARKAFETKPTEKRSLVIPGLKVSSARKAFETSGNKEGTSSKSSIPKFKQSDNKTTKPSDGNNSNGFKDTPLLGKGIKITAKDSDVKIKKKEWIVSPKSPVDSKPGTSGKQPLALQTMEVVADDNKGFGRSNSCQETMMVSPSIAVSETSQNKVAGFLPTLDVTMAVKPPKKEKVLPGKPPQAPRGGESNTGDLTPDTMAKPPIPLGKATKDGSESPAIRPPVRRLSFGKSSASSSTASSTSSVVDASTGSALKNAKGKDSPAIEGTDINTVATSQCEMVALPEKDSKKSVRKNSSSSSKDITGSETSFLARAFGHTPITITDKQHQLPQSQTLQQQPQTQHQQQAHSPVVSVGQKLAELPKPKTTKVTSVEIMLNTGGKPEKSSNEPPQQTVVTKTENRGVPQPTLCPTSSGKFTLLGVKSEVSFNVDAPSEPPKPTENSSMYFSVTLPPPPPVSPVCDLSRPDVPLPPHETNGNARVVNTASTKSVVSVETPNEVPVGTKKFSTSLLKRDIYEHQISKEESNVACQPEECIIPVRVEGRENFREGKEPKNVESLITPTSTKKAGRPPRMNIQDRNVRSGTPGSADSQPSTSGDKHIRGSQEARRDTEDILRKEGYGMYRSKFRSMQKAFLDESELRAREPSLERSESFSSTGSTDDLEDIFEGLTGDSLISNLLSRTRHLIDEIRRDDSPRFGSIFDRSSALGGTSLSGFRSSFERPDPFSRFESLFSRRGDSFGHSDSFKKSSGLVDSSSGIGSSRTSRTSRQNSEGSDNSSASQPSWQSSSNTEQPNLESFFSDTAASTQKSRATSTSNSSWNYSRANSREDDSAMSDSGSHASLSRRSMYNFSRSVNSSISEEDVRSSSSSSTATSRTASTAKFSNDDEGGVYARSRDSSVTRESSSVRRDSFNSTSSSQRRSSWNSRFRGGGDLSWESSLSYRLA